MLSPTGVGQRPTSNPGSMATSSNSNLPDPRETELAFQPESPLAASEDYAGSPQQTPSLSNRVNETPPSSAEARAKRSEYWNSVATLVERTANAFPERLAVVDASSASRRAPGKRAERSIHYGELNERADDLARCLRSLGVGAEDVIALRLNRSIELVVAALGVLKAGAAYLPLNPQTPAAHTRFELDDARAPAIVTDTAHSHDSESYGRSVLVLDDDGRVRKAPKAAPLSPESARDRGEAPNAESLAYVIYTSGSTGQPKGVEVTHGNLLNLVLWHQKAFELIPADRMTLLASVEFDASVWEMWPVLCTGASLHIPDELTRRDPAALRDWLVKREISISFAPTPLAERLNALPWPAPTRLHTLLTGGDTLHVHPRAGLPFRVINNYGPTECAVVATSGLVPPGPHAAGLPGIGRPIANATIHILDENLQSAASGEAGEICIGGAGVARGYRNQTELTRQKFVPDPFSDESGARLYRTGDLGRLLASGEIAFLGRIDTQVKIRGFRIELEAIAAVLNEHPGVKQSTVIARDYGASDKRLIAYVVLEHSTPATQTVLREHLAARLPEQMIPAVFVSLAELPLNGNGKVDRAGLPEPDELNRLAVKPYVGARTATEQRLAELLAPLLHVERVSVEDNFFMLGGHSLLGTQLIARMRAAFGVEVSLRTLFECPTIAALASEVDRLVLRGASRAASSATDSSKMGLGR